MNTVRLGLATLFLLCITAILVPAAPAGAAQAVHCQSGNYDCTKGTGYGATTGTWADKYYYGGQHNCTRYVAYRLAKNGLGDPGRSWGNATNWWTNAPGVKNQTPAVGAIAYWAANKKPASQYGHIAWVESANADGSVTVTEDNASPYNYDRRVTYSGADGPSGYIHIQGSSQYFTPKTHNPEGSIDGASSPGAGQVSVRGWALDRDNTNAALEVHVYVGGEAGSPGVEGHSLTANQSRPDVNSALGVGGNHGFSGTVTTGKSGNIPVCIYAINVGGGGNTLLGCRTVGVSNANPRGAFDEASAPVPHLLNVRGWAFDPNDATGTSEVHIYVGPQPGQPGSKAHIIRANKTRDDVNKAYGISGKHGYDEWIVTGRKGTQLVCAYAINVGLGNSNPQIGCKTVALGGLLEW